MHELPEEDYRQCRIALRYTFESYAPINSKLSLYATTLLMIEAMLGELR